MYRSPALALEIAPSLEGSWLALPGGLPADQVRPGDHAGVRRGRLACGRCDSDDVRGGGAAPHKDLRLYDTWRGKSNKRQGQTIVISTAGEPGSQFEERPGADPGARRGREAARVVRPLRHRPACAPRVRLARGGGSGRPRGRQAGQPVFSGITVGSLTEKFGRRISTWGIGGGSRATCPPRRHGRHPGEGVVRCDRPGRNPSR